MTTARIAAMATMGALLLSCGSPGRVDELSRDQVPIYPDYKGVTVPTNIAPLNFNYLGEGKAVVTIEAGGKTVRLRARRGLVSFKPKLWKSLLAQGDSLKITLVREDEGRRTSFQPFSIHIAEETIDPFLSYRLIPPGYQAWNKMGIYQRNLEAYSQTPVFENRLADGNCVNCHSYPNGDASSMLFHSRAVFPGTLVVRDEAVEKLNTKTDSTISALVYPSWHPSGRFVAFSVNTTNQNFFNHSPNRVEVYDSASDVVVYDVENHRILHSPLTKSTSSFETFPTFSPDGKSLYFCTAEAIAPMPENYDKVKYALCRIDFDTETLSFGEKVDTVFHPDGKSVSFPRVSPDGRFLALTLHEFGNFSIWHREADLWAIDLKSGAAAALDEANSIDVESYHSWSRNSRWLVFSSRRLELDGRGRPVSARGEPIEECGSVDGSGKICEYADSAIGGAAGGHAASSSDRAFDGSAAVTGAVPYPGDNGLYTRLYICHIDSTGRASKPFLLPQRNPLHYYRRLMVSYNIPELMTGKVRTSQRKLASTLRRSEGIDVR